VAGHGAKIGKDVARGAVKASAILRAFIQLSTLSKACLLRRLGLSGQAWAQPFFLRQVVAARKRKSPRMD